MAVINDHAVSPPSSNGYVPGTPRTNQYMSTPGSAQSVQMALSDDDFLMSIPLTDVSTDIPNVASGGGSDSIDSVLAMLQFPGEAVTSPSASASASSPATPGAAVNAPDPDGNTPVALCARLGNVPALNMLISHGASIDTPNNNGDAVQQSKNNKEK